GSRGRSGTGVIRIDGRAADRRPDLAESGRDPTRSPKPPAGGARRDGPARPRSAGVTALRRTRQQRSCRGARDLQGRGQQASRTGAETAQGDSGRTGSLTLPGAGVSMAEGHADNSVDELAEEFARRWRAGEEPSVEEYAARHPQ